MHHSQTSPFAKKLRQNQTDAENLIWLHLRNRRFQDLKFRRQHPMGPYIVDFICLEKQLIIELDGGQHAKINFYEQTRTHYFQKQGFKILRFWNNDVLMYLPAIIEKIMLELNIQ